MPYPEIKEPGPGYKSSTFWLSAGSAFLGFLLASGIIGQSQHDAIVEGVKQIVGGAAMIWPIVNYGIQRTKRRK